MSWEEVKVQFLPNELNFSCSRSLTALIELELNFFNFIQLWSGCCCWDFLLLGSLSQLQFMYVIKRPQDMNQGPWDPA